VTQEQQRPEPDLERRRWEQFGAWLKASRLDRGLTVTEVAKRAGVGLQTLAALEAGGFRRTSPGPWLTPNPKDETLIAVARALELDPEELFRRVGRYDDRPATRRSLRRASGRQDQDRTRINELERENAELRQRLERLEQTDAEADARIREVLTEIAARLDAIEARQGSPNAGEDQQPKRRRASA
jgi:transcriptional regulator with XRE-family HTH domain